MRCTVEVGLDNNALSTMLDRESVGGLAARTRRHGIRLIIGQMTITEITRGGDQGTDRITATAALAKELGNDYLRVAETVRMLVFREQNGWSRRETPWIRPNPLLRVLDLEKTEIAEWRAELGPRLAAYTGQAWWESQLAHARRTAESHHHDLLAAWVAALPGSLRRQLTPNVWGIENLVPLEKRGDGLGLRRRVVADPWRYPAHAAALGGRVLSAAAGALKDAPEVRNRSRWGPALNPGRNDWADEQVVTSYARCPFLVTDDKIMRERLQLLGAAGMTFVVGVPTAGFP